MNYFLPLYQRKLALMQAAAPRAALRCLHDADGFRLFLSEAAQAGKLGIGRLENKADDPLMDDPVLDLFVPLDQMQQFIEAATPVHSVALIDVMSADRVHAARHVVYAYFPRKVTTFADHMEDLRNSIVLEPPTKEKQPSADFWG